MLLIFAIIAVVLYTRNTKPVDSYREYFKNKGIGGGAVIRPQPAQAKVEAPYKVPQIPLPDSTEDAPKAPGPPPVAAPAKVESSTTSATATSSSSSSSQDAFVPPTPAPAIPVAPEDELPYQIGEGRVEVSMEMHARTTTVHWARQPEHFPVSETIQLPTASSIPLPRIQREVKKLADAGADMQKLAAVKEAAQHAWKGYRDYALGSDEIRPNTAGVNNPFNAWGATLVDALDTLWIAGMKVEFEEAVAVVGKIDFTTSPRQDIPVFETTIRYLGGLIAAYDISGQVHRVLLDKAVELAEVLFSIFDTPNRMPITYYRWNPSSASQMHRSPSKVILAEIGTLSLEFTRLAQLTKEPKYYDAIARITDAFEEWQNSTRLPGMWPTTFDSSGCNMTATRLLKAAKELAEIGEGGKNLSRSTTVQDDSGNKLESDPYELKQGLQKSLEGSSVSRRPSGGDSTDSGNPHKASSVKDNSSSPQQPAAGNSQGLGVPTDTGTFQGKGAVKEPLDLVPDSLKQRRTPPEFLPSHHDSVRSNGQLDECVPQGFASSSANGQEVFTLSGASDSMYEYLPKEYMLLGGAVEKYRSMYLDSAEAAIERLLFKPMTIDERDDILMVGELRLSPNYAQPAATRGYNEKFKAEVAHLACFAGGMFAMGGVLFNKPEHVDIGAKLTEGCVWAYNSTATGIMPEGAEVIKCPETWGDCRWNETAYWDELDPFWQSRLKIKPVPVPVPVVQEATRSEAAPDNDFAPPLSELKAAPVGPRPPEPSLNLPKRQLRDDAVDSAARPVMPGTPSRPLANQPAPPQAVSNAPAAAVYTPPPPLSHQEFVEKKILEERLPPSFTRLTYKKYMLRPEAIESVFYLYRITGDQHWRDVGWRMFQAIDRHTRAPHGHSAIDDVTKAAPEQTDQEESFWLAETLKYFILLFEDPAVGSLDEWVLNTEAHFFRRPDVKFEQGKFS